MCHKVCLLLIMTQINYIFSGTLVKVVLKNRSKCKCKSNNFSANDVDVMLIKEYIYEGFFFPSPQPQECTKQYVSGYNNVFSWTLRVIFGI